jgi:hypothetical protein
MQFEIIAPEEEETKLLPLPVLEVIPTGKKNSWLSHSPSRCERRTTNALLIFFCIICPTVLFLTALNGIIHVAPIFILPHLSFIANLLVGIASGIFACIFTTLVIFRIARSDEHQNELFELGCSGECGCWKAFWFRVIGAHEKNNPNEHPELIEEQI